MEDSRIVATLTNLAYLVAGLACYSVGVGAPAVFLAALCFLSAAHHWWSTDFTRILDYLGMYWVGTSIFLVWLGLPFGVNVIITAAVALTMVAFFKASRVMVGIVIAAALIAVTRAAGFPALMITLFPLAVAWTFNYAGDNVHRAHHETYHGVGWHTVSATACMLAAGFAAGINILTAI